VPKFSSFKMAVPPPLHPGVVGPYPVHGTWLPSRLPLGGNRDVFKFVWVITGGPWYPGYRTPTVAHEPSVERVVRVVHSLGGRSGTLMSLQVLLRDSMVRPWG
jgi:hypothetical protein